MRNRQTLSERWFFYQDTASLWKWARLDLLGTVLAQAQEAFPSRDACLDDARRCGYSEEGLPRTDFAVRPPARRVRSRASSPNRY